MNDRATPSARSDYPIFYSLESRWADNDIYGHINNVAYYAYFDSVVNRFLIEEGGLRPACVWGPPSVHDAALMAKSVQCLFDKVELPSREGHQSRRQSPGPQYLEASGCHHL